GVIGIAAGLLLPFIGPAIAGGVLIAALGGAALGAVAGGFMGAFVRMGVPEEQARQYEQEFKAGRTIITVKTDDRQQDALNILSNNGAIYFNAHDRAV
ncbi:MAG: low temperature-induced protein, partial [Ktedonobacteraceae bacterium]